MGLWKTVIFPFLFERSGSNAYLAALRKDLLSKVRGSVLEVGFGSGHNLPYYPREIDFIAAIEPNSGMRRRAVKRNRRFNFEIRWIDSTDDRFALTSSSCDTVVSTLTLCSVKNPKAILSEIKRVLKPTGQLLFLEHGLDPDPIVQKKQFRIEPFQMKIKDGCRMTLEMQKLIEANGFTIRDVKNIHIPGPMNFKVYYWLGSASPDVS